MAAPSYSIIATVRHVVGGQNKDSRVYVGCVRSPSERAIRAKIKREGITGIVLGWTIEEVARA
jgi:hypothetical protein